MRLIDVLFAVALSGVLLSPAKADDESDLCYMSAVTFWFSQKCPLAMVEAATPGIDRIMQAAAKVHNTGPVCTQRFNDANVGIAYNVGKQGLVPFCKNVAAVIKKNN